MAKVINLRTRRKQNARNAARKTGDENAARHGISKIERQTIDAETEKSKRHIDLHKIVKKKDEAE
ncbi:DUF4169 family protein [Pararhodobacter oceanensis]|uniref:DUF4169 family protein n=1 Tax=Pararhodobacter oceanensis TaxID=2172121 RepID=UPI003A9229AE